ncbi:hypothetical protein [Streptomyces longwoodensis]|uniref:hypothetical protein n=1 Tax=Streptomyces longwoodensis TaxID=68231 RepID=UPI00324F0113
MSDQHAASAVTAAVAVALILVARAAILHQGRRHAGTRAHVRRGVTRAAVAVPDGAAADPAVREAEQYVHHCWQQLRTRTDPPE